MRTQSLAPEAPARRAAAATSAFSASVMRIFRVEAFRASMGSFGRPTTGIMCAQKRNVNGLDRAVCVRTLISMDAIKVLVLVSLTGCSGSAFSTGTDFTNDDAGTQVVATDADAGKTPDAAPEVSMRADAAPDAPVPACTCGDAGASCLYSVNEPPAGYGVPYPVTTVVLTPSAPTATFTTTVVSPPQPYHNSVLYDLDLSAFTKGGTLYINGQVDDAGCTVSEYLLAQCETVPPTGSFTYLEGYGNAIGAWAFPSYQFPAGTTVLHFGTEGSWGNPTGATNTNRVTVLVQP